MSLDATRWAWEQKVKATQKLVLLSLADRADEKHCCFPSVSRMSNDTSLDRKTVMNCIQKLKELGLISIKKTDGNKNYYRLIGVKNRHETSAKNGTSPETGTGTKNGTSTSTKNGTLPVPKTGHKSTNNLPINLPKGFNQEIPSYIDLELFGDFLDHRKKMKAQNTIRGMKVLLTEIHKVHEAGFDVNEQMETSISRGWKTIYIPKTGNQAMPDKTNPWDYAI